MFRILGFLFGSATSIAIILLVVGMPEFHVKDMAGDQQRFADALEKLMAKRQDAVIARKEGVEVDSPLPDEVIESTAVNPFVEEQQRGADTPELPVADTDSDLLAETGESNAAPVAPAVLNELQWYSFWNPFRSEIAATGFVAQLERVTGIDYRVVKIKPGVYEVAFAFDDDAERHAKLSQISAATGLDLPDS